MKLPISIVAVFLMLAVNAVEVTAQTRSSAAQTVTFGVQRSAAIIAANFQPSTESVNEIGLTSATPLKVTAGSDVSSVLVADLGADRSASEFDRGVSPVENVHQSSLVSRRATPPITKLRNYTSDSSDRLVITLTE